MPDFNDLESFIHQLTPRANNVLILAKKEAERLNHDYIGTEHLLLGLIALGEGVAVSVLRSMNLNLDKLRIEVEKHCGVGGGVKMEGDIPLTPRLKKVLILSAKEAKSMNYQYIGTEHLLLALLKEGESVAARILKGLNVDPAKVRQEVIKALDPNYLPDGATDFSYSAEEGAEKDKEKLTMLHAFGRDLTKMARNGELDPVIGRNNEIERIIQILCRRTKNNPVLIGEAGVGKTAIVEGLAHAIAEAKVPEILRTKKIFVLDLPLMVAGTKFRGQFEERIKSVIDEVRNSGKVILFIDELHTIVGAGGSEGAMDAANIIKPALSRGELQCIGATTMNEYRKGIEKDAALERRFQPIIVDPPTIEDTIEILKGLKPKYEQYHNVTYSDEAIKTAVKLSDRYISGRFLPDKAIDIMDEAGARAHISQSITPPDVGELEAKIKEIMEKKAIAIGEQNYEAAAIARDEERDYKIELKNKLAEWKKNCEKNTSVVDIEDITDTIAKFTGIPVQQIEVGESMRLLKMEEEIGKVVIGQEPAVETIARALRRARADMKDPKRPIGSFIFLGPTGVGKTLLAKALAEFIFGDSDALIQIDMSEYMEKFNVSRLIGSPPGYVGHEEGGQLTERVRRKPYSVVLFDEIEKAHPDVMHILLQILEEGKITDSLGRRIDFRNTIIIMTSNLGAEKILKGGGVVGFGSVTEDTSNSAAAKDKLIDMAKKHFKPEFINRIDEVIVFRRLSNDDLLKIVDIELSNVRERLADRNIKLNADKEVYKYLIKHGYQPEYGARPLKRAIERFIEDPIAEDILRGKFESAQAIKVELDKDKLIFLPVNEDSREISGKSREEQKAKRKNSEKNKLQK